MYWNQVYTQVMLFLNNCDTENADVDGWMREELAET